MVTYKISGKYLHNKNTYGSKRVELDRFFNSVLLLEALKMKRRLQRMATGNKVIVLSKKYTSRCMYKYNLLPTENPVQSTPLLSVKQRI